MLRLKANKTSLYKLVGTYEALPPMRQVRITKALRAPDWWLKWTDAEGLLCVAFFTCCMGRPVLTVEKKELGGPRVSRLVYNPDINDLLERGMVERVPTAVRRIRDADFGEGGNYEENCLLQRRSFLCIKDSLRAEMDKP